MTPQERTRSKLIRGLYLYHQYVYDSVDNAQSNWWEYCEDHGKYMSDQVRESYLLLTDKVSKMTILS